MITAEIISGKRIPTQLLAEGKLMQSAVAKTMQRLAIRMVTLVKTKLSGEVLNVRTGRLRRSIHYSMESAGAVTTVIVGTNVAYAPIHEFGGVIPAHLVQARNAQALRFSMNGKTVFAKSAHIPAIKMPKRSFLQSSLEQLMPEMRQAMVTSVQGVIKAGV